MNLRRLRYFVVLAQELHFGRAAALLHVAQPALTQNLHLLEQELGVGLLARSSRRVELTEAGRVLLEDARRLLAQAQAVQDRMRAFAAGRSGSLRLSYARSALGGLSSTIVDALRAAVPDVKLEINSQYTARSVEELVAGQLDAAFVRTPLGPLARTAPGLQELLIDREPLVVGLPRGHRLARRQRIPVAELRDEPLVTGSPHRAPGFYESMFRQIWGRQEPRVVLREPDEEHMLRAVAAGTGVTILTRSRAELIQVAGVVIRPFAPPPPTVGLSLAWMQDNRNAALATLVRVATALTTAPGAGMPPQVGASGSRGAGP